MTVDPEGNLWFSYVTQHDANFEYHCYAKSLIMYECYTIQIKILYNNSLNYL